MCAEDDDAPEAGGIFFRYNLIPCHNAKRSFRVPPDGVGFVSAYGAMEKEFAVRKDVADRDCIRVSAVAAERKDAGTSVFQNGLDLIRGKRLSASSHSPEHIFFLHIPVKKSTGKRLLPEEAVPYCHICRPVLFSWRGRFTR